MIVTENSHHRHAFEMISSDQLQVPESTTQGIMMDNTVTSGHREPELKIGIYTYMHMISDTDTFMRSVPCHCHLFSSIFPAL